MPLQILLRMILSGPNVAEFAPLSLCQFPDSATHNEGSGLAIVPRHQVSLCHLTMPHLRIKRRCDRAVRAVSVESPCSELIFSTYVPVRIAAEDCTRGSEDWLFIKSSGHSLRDLEECDSRRFSSSIGR